MKQKSGAVGFLAPILMTVQRKININEICHLICGENG